MADGKLVLAVGASRSGKTAWVKNAIAEATRLLVWDVEGQYAGRDVVRLTTRRELVHVVENCAGPGRFAFVAPQLTDFDYWCRCAFVFARIGARAGLHTVIVAEELADVTSPGKAPEGWGIMVRRGLKYDCDIYAITQRPSESDKTVCGNASVIHCCGLQRYQDRKYMAAEMDIDPGDIAGLNRQKLEFIEKDMRSGDLIRGALTFR